MDGIAQRFHELSYELQRQHWIDDGASPERLRVHESWFREDHIDFWRHERMYEAVFECLSHSKLQPWLTLGDGRYGLDAIRMMRRGFQDVMATDLGDQLLRISFEAGALKKYSAENAEKLSFTDQSFDYVLCKESFHHFPRPMLALYEMLRVARKGVVLIEPQDPYIDFPVMPGKRSAAYESDGNYLYSLSRAELEKVALGLNLPAVAFKNIYDIFRTGLELEPATDSNPVFLSFKEQVRDLEARCEKGESKYNVLMAVIFQEMPEDDTIAVFLERGWTVDKLERNPFQNRLNAL